jgi:hypothetical protein
MVAALEKANVPVTLIVKQRGAKMANWIDGQLR